MRGRIGCGLIVAWACSAGQAGAAPACATSIAGLRALLADESFALEWRETTMDDEKPLVFSVLERDGTLFFAFVKTGEGPWAEGAVVVCRDGPRLEALLAAERLKIGPAAHWAVRYAFATGARFTLAPSNAGLLRIETSGWNGVFARQP